MAWSNSKIFMAVFEDLFENVTAMKTITDTQKAALYNNTTAPDQTVTSANTAYAVGQWVVGNEVSDAAEWPAGGETLSSVTSTRSSNVFTFDAADEVSTGTSATLAAVFGCLVYDDTIATPVADQGWCYNYFGGTNSVTDGTFTIVWNASGIFAITA